MDGFGGVEDLVEGGGERGRGGVDLVGLCLMAMEVQEVEVGGCEIG